MIQRRKEKKKYHRLYRSSVILDRWNNPEEIGQRTKTSEPTLERKNGNVKAYIDIRRSSTSQRSPERTVENKIEPRSEPFSWTNKKRH